MGKVWFDREEGQSPKVAGFELPDCPHGILRRNGDESEQPFEYMCERCGVLFIEAEKPKEE